MNAPLPPRLCRCGCGRPVKIGGISGVLPARNGLPAYVDRTPTYYAEGCLERVEAERKKAKNLARRAPAPGPRLCACGCGETFTPKRDGVRFVSKAHAERASAERGKANREGGGVLVSASRQAAERARAERCPAPGCGAALGADGPLLYCAARCGWDELLTAKARDVRAGTPEPARDEDDDQEPDDQEPDEMAIPEHDPDDQDDQDDATEADTPPSHPEVPATSAPTLDAPPSTRERILAALAAGPLRAEELRRQVGGSSGGLQRPLRDLTAEGQIDRHDIGNHRVVYALPGAVLPATVARSPRLDSVRLDSPASLDPVVAAIRERGTCTAAELGVALGLSRAAVTCRLVLLMNGRRVVAEGQGPRRVYRVAGEVVPLRLVPPVEAPTTVTPAPTGASAAALLAALRAMPPAERDAALDALAPLVAARSQMRAALEALGAAS